MSNHHPASGGRGSRTNAAYRKSFSVKVFLVLALTSLISGCAPGQAEVDQAARNALDAAMPMMQLMNPNVPKDFRPSHMIETVNRHGCSRGSGGHVCTVSVKFKEPFASSMSFMLSADGAYRTRFLMIRTDDGWYAEEVLNNSLVWPSPCDCQVATGMCPDHQQIDHSTSKNAKEPTLETSQVLAMVFGTIFAMTAITAPLWVDILHERRERKSKK